MDFSYLHDYMIYPNPAEDYVDVDLDAARFRAVDLSIIDGLGKVLRQQKVKSAPIGPVRMNLEDLPTGLYFLRVEAEGLRDVVKKLVIAR